MLNLKKKLKKLRKQINLFVFICISTLVLSNAFADDEFWLLTETEYALLDIENSIDEKLNYSLNTGPKINLVSPNIIEKVDAPVNIFIKFENSPEGSEPNMDTLIVKLKGLITLDITKRVEKFIEGYELNIKNAQIPKGKHKILIMIMDINYNYSERLITFTVS